MTKFIITGFKRSGTTYLASILNSQKNSFCFEFNPFNFKNIKNIEEHNLFNSKIDALFINLGMKGPNLRDIYDYQEQENAFIEFFHNKHKTHHAGFKVTNLYPTQLNMLIKRGYKIIHIKRNIKDTLRSYVFRIGNEKNQLSFAFKRYLEEFNNSNLQSQKHKYLVIKYENLINNKKNVLKKLSNFLNFNINGEVDLYHSFNKGRYIFKNNSSYKNLDLKDEIYNLEKYCNFIEGRFDLHLSSYYLMKKLKNFFLN